MMPKNTTLMKYKAMFPLLVVKFG